MGELFDFPGRLNQRISEGTKPGLLNQMNTFGYIFKIFVRRIINVLLVNVCNQTLFHHRVKFEISMMENMLHQFPYSDNLAGNMYP